MICQSLWGRDLGLLSLGSCGGAGRVWAPAALIWSWRIHFYTSSYDGWQDVLAHMGCSIGYHSMVSDFTLKD